MNIASKEKKGLCARVDLCLMHLFCFLTIVLTNAATFFFTGR